MKTFTDDEITRELNCYPVAAGINKGGDIMRQLKRERDELRARLERAEEDSKRERKETAALMLKMERWRMYIVDHCKENVDHACPLCRPKGSVVIAGWICVPHQAAMSAPSAKPGEKEGKHES